MKCRRDLFGSFRNEMFTRPVVPTVVSFIQPRFDSGKNCRQDFDQTSRTLRGGLHLGLQGFVISGINLFHELLTLIKSAKIAMLSGRDVVTG